MKNALFVSLVCCAAAVVYAHPGHGHASPPWQQPSVWPDRIITTATAEPGTGFGVAWRTDQSVGEAIAQIAVASSDARFDLGASTVVARTSALRLDAMAHATGDLPVIENAGLDPVHFHQVRFGNLPPDTLYAYRVRGARGWTDLGVVWAWWGRHEGL